MNATRTERRFVNPSTLYTPPGPYSQVVRVGDLAFVAGQVGMNHAGVLAGSGITVQAGQAIKNIASALESVGLGLAHVVKVTIFVPYAEDLDELVPYMDAAFGDFFTGGYPASSLLVIDRLFDPELRIEIEAVAHA
ncbi:MAG: RidA family protein [Microbacteriaceae bacterium]|nr:RidA family protein [Microbacteriaceae bacterium]